MKKLIFIFALLLSTLSNQAFAKVQVFACEPEWKSLVDEIGGNLVESFSATNNLQDPHHIRAKPSLIAKMRHADLLVCTGADLEIGWLPILLQNAKSSVQFGQIGSLMVADFVKLKEKPKSVDRSMGDVHPQGNPHLHLDPNNILFSAKEMTVRLQVIDPENSLTYQKNYDQFAKKWQESMKIWQAKAVKLKGKNVVVRHKSFVYLLGWLQMNEIATLEPVPGVSPTVSHLNSLLVNLKKNPADFIILTPYDPKDAADWLAKKNNLKIIELPYTVGKGDDLFKMFDQTIDLLLGD